MTAIRSGPKSPTYSASIFVGNGSTETKKSRSRLSRSKTESTRSRWFVIVEWAIHTAPTDAKLTR